MLTLASLVLLGVAIERGWVWAAWLAFGWLVMYELVGLLEDA